MMQQLLTCYCIIFNIQQTAMRKSLYAYKDFS